MSWHLRELTLTTVMPSELYYTVMCHALSYSRALLPQRPFKTLSPLSLSSLPLSLSPREAFAVGGGLAGSGML